MRPGERKVRAGLATALLGGLLMGAATGSLVASAGGAGADRQTRLAERFGAAPLAFVENRGHLDPAVGYWLRGARASVWFTDTGFTLAQTEGNRRYVTALDFVGARPIHPTGVDPAAGLVNVFAGPEAEWATGLRTFSRLVYRDLWPGIDLTYSGAQDRLKYEFTVHPGADPSAIRLAWRGAEGVTLDPEGRLMVATPLVRSPTTHRSAPRPWTAGSAACPAPSGCWATAPTASPSVLTTGPVRWSSTLPCSSTPATSAAPAATPPTPWPSTATATATWPGRPARATPRSRPVSGPTSPSAARPTPSWSR